MTTHRKMAATIIASAIAAVSLIGMTGTASAAMTHKPSICIFLPLCQSAPPAPMTHHHVHKK